MLSFKRFLLEYDVDADRRKQSLPSFKGLRGPSISKNLYNQRDFFLDHLDDLHRKGLMSDLFYDPSDSIMDPLVMSSEDLLDHLNHAKKHLPDYIHDDLDFAVDTIILHNPMDNLTLQNKGGVKGTISKFSPDGSSDEEGESAGENLDDVHQKRFKLRTKLNVKGKYFKKIKP